MASFIPKDMRDVLEFVKMEGYLWSDETEDYSAPGDPMDVDQPQANAEVQDNVPGTEVPAEQQSGSRLVNWYDAEDALQDKHFARLYTTGAKLIYAYHVKENLPLVPPTQLRLGAKEDGIRDPLRAGSVMNYGRRGLGWHRALKEFMERKRLERQQALAAEQPEQDADGDADAPMPQVALDAQVAPDEAMEAAEGGSMANASVRVPYPTRFEGDHDNATHVIQWYISNFPSRHRLWRNLKKKEELTVTWSEPGPDPYRADYKKLSWKFNPAKWRPEHISYPPIHGMDPEQVKQRIDSVLRPQTEGMMQSCQWRELISGIFDVDFWEWRPV
ncbi:MAG: hypothetical protein L6R35_007537, partial [Caloplaca aegaea]